jgi:hypothetical protein
MILAIVIVGFFLLAGWLENSVERRARGRRKIKSRLPRRVG